MRFAVAFLCAMALARPGLAEGAGGTVAVASRLFLVGEVPGASTRMEDFLPLTRVPWAWHMIQDDPVLDGAVVHIRQRPSPPAYLFSRERLAHHFPDTARVPEALRIDGYEVATNAGAVARSVLFRPDVPEPDFVVTCEAADDIAKPDDFNLCVVMASYPLDPAMVLEAALYFPLPFAELHPRFELIADRLREIALCLDVTDAPPSDPEEALQVLLAANPTLEGCADRLAS